MIVRDGTPRGERSLPSLRRLELAPGGVVHLLVDHERGRSVAIAGRTLAYVDQLEGALGERSLVYVAALAAGLPEDGLSVRTEPMALSCPPAHVPLAPSSFHGIVGQSKGMFDIFGRIEKVAAGAANVCIYGESGTGKELIARAIHDVSRRRTRPLITLDCTTIPEGLMEAHLFGHVKGAFTGAVEQRAGVFSLADTGTLFVDELCSLNLHLQTKLLRVIQTREFFKVGSSKATRTDIRLIIATHRDLMQMVEEGSFREDLYYRVAVVVLKVPPLRERREDIPLLVDHFIRRLATTYRRAGLHVEPAAVNHMMRLPWPGNVRQLENFLEQAVVLTDGDALTESDLFAGREAAPTRRTPAHLEPELPLSEVERRHILSTLRKVRGRRAEAAKLLGISLRSLQYKLKSYRQEGCSALSEWPSRDNLGADRAAEVPEP